MPLKDSDLKTYYPSSHPDNDVDSQGGGINLAEGVVSESTPGAWFPNTAANPAGGADIVHRYKLFRKNTHATDTLYQPRFWIFNGMQLNSSAGVVTIVTSTTESGKVRIGGFSGGSPTTEDISVSGAAGSYVGVTNWDANSIWWAYKIDNSGSPANNAGKIEIWRGTLLGIIPAPNYDTGDEVHTLRCATAEYELGLDPALNGSTSAANRLTDPTGVTFSRPTTEASGLLLPGAADLTAGSYIGYWGRRTIKAGLPKPPGPIRIGIILSGTI
jgi:hypothetical protein